MVKGVSRQVILVRSPDPKLFEQAIFILREDAGGVTDEMLLREAVEASRIVKHESRLRGPLWAACGALCTAAIWALTVLL